MSVSLDDLIDGAKALANLEDLGDGPNDFLTDSQWANLANGSIEALHKKIVVWNERALFATQDYDLTTTGGDITPPVGYRTFKQLSILDGAGNECRPVHRYAPAQLTNLGEVHYLPQGLSKIQLRPALLSKQKYRLSYTAGPALLSGGDAPSTQQTTDATAKVMIDQSYPFTLFQTTPDIIQQTLGLSAVAAGVLPGNWTPSGSGPTRTLTATVNGATTVGGVLLAVPNPVLVLGGGGLSASDQGLYLVISVGTGGSPTVMIRSPSYDQASEVTFGSAIYVAGGVNAGNSFVMNVPGAIVVDTTPLNFANSGIPKLLVDGTQVAAGDTLFINTGGNQTYDGLYGVAINPGTVAAVWQFVRSAGQTQGTSHPVGYTIAVTQGVANGNKIYIANGNIIWSVSSPTWTTLKAALDPLYVPSREWLEVRTAVRALGKEESNETANALNARLTELTSEAMEFYKNLDQGEAPQATRHDLDSQSLGWRIYNGII